MICPTCSQPIRRGEKTDTFADVTHHENPRDCVRATARRCARIARRTCMSISDGKSAAFFIREEFGLKGRA